MLLSRLFRSDIPLKWILIIPFAGQILVSVGLVCYLCNYSGEKALQGISEKLTIEIGEKIEEYLHSHLQTAQKVNQLNKKKKQSEHLCVSINGGKHKLMNWEENVRKMGRNGRKWDKNKKIASKNTRKSENRK